MDTEEEISEFKGTIKTIWSKLHEEKWLKKWGENQRAVGHQEPQCMVSQSPQMREREGRNNLQRKNG